MCRVKPPEPGSCAWPSACHLNVSSPELPWLRLQAFVDTDECGYFFYHNCGKVKLPEVVPVLATALPTFLIIVVPSYQWKVEENMKVKSLLVRE
ncbi:hypothetical protein KSP39_PZI007280 [Platanthera zijinensis]|uniref:Uncharacterized protein n=1 Tax=Platanthera zijinensis TaxID=2320716 RepID=A0AAP0GA50_9ASPA